MQGGAGAKAYRSGGFSESASSMVQRLLILPEFKIAVIGFLTLAGAASLPFFGAITLLSDENYVFWEGRFFPYLVICVCLAVLLLLVFTMFIFWNRASVNNRSEESMLLVAGNFAALLGICLLLISLYESADVYDKMRHLAGGCHNSLAEAAFLTDYTQVLYNIRSQPTCRNQTSVEMCDGWSENKYTKYARYLETHFQCGPLCSGQPMPADMFYDASAQPLAQEAMAPSPAPAASPVASFLEQFSEKVSSWREARAGLRSGAHLQVDNVARSLSLQKQEQHAAAVPKAYKLFSQGTTKMDCFPLVATRLQVLGWCFGDLLFWQGFGLICVSVITSLYAMAELGRLHKAAKRSRA